MLSDGSSLIPSHYCGHGYNPCQATPWVEVVIKLTPKIGMLFSSFLSFILVHFFSKIKVESECGLCILL